MAFKLTPETLDEGRLRRSVDPEIFKMGQELFANEQVQVLEVTDLEAACFVEDKRKYRVSIKITKNMLVFQCSCSHGIRGLICEHDVAAWMGVERHLRQNVYPAWREQVNKITEALSLIPSEPQAPYLLYFCLQAPTSSHATWKISPYQFPLSILPRALYQEDQPLDMPAIQHYLETNPDLLFQVGSGVLNHRSTQHYADPPGCVNCPPQAVTLANIMLDREYVYSDTASLPLKEYLALLASGGYPLYLGSPWNPLEQRLQILPEPGELHLNLEKNEKGISIGPRLAAAGQSLAYRAGEVQIIQTSPTWVLAGGYVFRLDNEPATGMLSVFWNRPEVFIPAKHEADFLDKHYLELARRIPLEGSAVTWEEITLDPVPRLYLSEVEGELQAELRFGYGQIEIRYDTNMPGETLQHQPGAWTLSRIHRQPDAEKTASDLLASASYGLKRAPFPAPAGLFRLRARTQPVDFLLHDIPRLARSSAEHPAFEIYGEEQLKTARVNRNAPTISFSVSSGIDWFDVQTLVNFGELEVSLKEIRRAMRKKERFIKLADGSIGEIPEEWFEKYKHLFALGEVSEQGLRLSRHHLMLLDQALTDSGGSASADAEFERRRARLRALAHSDTFNGIETRELPEGFVGELRPYQKAGFDWLHFLHEMEFGGCLADDMGLGKTVQALVFLQSLYCGTEHRGPDRPAQASLLVVPRSLLVNWQREAARFTPSLQVMEYFETGRAKDLETFNQAHLVITTYGVMLRDIEFLHRYTFYYAILDESQAIKNPLSQTGRAARLLQASRRLALTGTPIENSTVELWSQFAFLNPGLLGSLEYFKEEFSTPIERKNDDGAAQTLRRMVYPFILRRTKDQVAPELPPRTERILYSDMDAAQRKLYNRTRDYYRGLLLGMLESEGLNGSRMKILEGLLRLRQISNHPRLVDNKFRGASGKFDLLMDTLETLQSENHKALVFSQFVQMLHLVRNEMDERHIPYAYLDGQTQDRQARVDAFQSDPNLPFFLISLKAGGLGLNLTAADYVIHIDPWWNPAVEMQASDRTHRIGQDKPVFVFKLIARDSVEEKILVLQERKRNLVDQIITTESAFFKNLTAEDVQALFS